MKIDASEAVRRPRTARVVIEPRSARYVVTTLREGKAGTGRSLAWFGAAAMENQARGLPGFLGAILLASDDDRLFLELTQWESEAALAAARRDGRYAEHHEILQTQSAVRQIIASSDVRGDAPFPFERGDVVAARGFAVLSGEVDRAPASVGTARRRGALAHAAPGPEGGWLLAEIATDERDLTPHPKGVDGTGWRASLRVVDVVPGDPFAADRPTHYRLRPAAGARSADTKQEVD